MSTVLSSVNSLYSKEALEEIKKGPIPGHIAVIMDGNRRFAQKQGKSSRYGHIKGAETLRVFAESAKLLGIKTVTLFAFSTENWLRSENEVRFLMSLFKRYFNKERKALVDQGVKLSSIGDLSKLPSSVLKAFEETKEATKYGNELNLVLAINYGGRNELTRAFGKIGGRIEKGEIKASSVDEELISSCLDTAEFGDPELLIRTSGDVRLSNFLLWQLSYSEIFIREEAWPEFTPDALLEVIGQYQKRKRKFGR